VDLESELFLFGCKIRKEMAITFNQEHIFFNNAFISTAEII